MSWWTNRFGGATNTFRFLSLKCINPIPKTTAFVVPFVVPKGITSDPRSIRARGMPFWSFVWRTSSVKV